MLWTIIYCRLFFRSNFIFHRVMYYIISGSDRFYFSLILFFFFLSHIFTAIELGAYNIDKGIEHRADISIYEVKD